MAKLILFCNLLPFTNSLQLFSVFENGLSKPVVASMAEGGISTSDLPSCFWVDYLIVLAKKLYQMSIFEITTMLANLTTKLTATVGMWDYF